MQNLTPPRGNTDSELHLTRSAGELRTLLQVLESVALRLPGVWILQGMQEANISTLLVLRVVFSYKIKRKIYISWGYNHMIMHHVLWAGLPQWLRDKESACNAGDTGSNHESGRFPGGGNGYPLLPGSSPSGSRVIQRGDGVGILGKSYLITDIKRD